MIKALEAAHGAKIQIRRAGDESAVPQGIEVESVPGIGDGSTKIVVVGQRAAVDAAKAAIVDLLRAQVRVLQDYRYNISRESSHN